MEKDLFIKEGEKTKCPYPLYSREIKDSEESLMRFSPDNIDFESNKKVYDSGRFFFSLILPNLRSISFSN